MRGGRRGYRQPEQEDARHPPQEDPEDPFPPSGEAEPEEKPNREGSFAASDEPHPGQTGILPPMTRASKTLPQAVQR